MRRFLSRHSRRRSSPMSEKRSASPTPYTPPLPNPNPYTYNRRGEMVVHEEGPEDEDEQSTAGLLAPVAPPPAPNLKVKRVDYFYSSWSKTWKYRNTSSKIRQDVLQTSVVGNGASDGFDPWQTYCFVVVRKLPRPVDGEQGDPTFQVVIKSTYLLTALKDVIQKVPGVSWTAEPLELDPYLLLAYLPRFATYHHDLEKKKNRTAEQSYVLQSLTILIDYLRKEYAATLAKITNLTAHGEITYDTLFAIFVPRTIVVSQDAKTGEQRAFELVSVTRMESLPGVYDLVCESIDEIDDTETASSTGTYGAGAFHPSAPMPYVPTPYIAPPPLPGAVDPAMAQANGKTYGRVQHRMFISSFKGTARINQLDVYPLEYHRNPAQLKAALVKRGRKWVSLRGIHHMQYESYGLYTLSAFSGPKRHIKTQIKSRVMIDRGTFRRLNSNYDMPVVRSDVAEPGASTDQYGNYIPSSNTPPPNSNYNVPTFQAISQAIKDSEEKLTDEELMLTPTVVYGFSLSDKTWMEFNIEHVQPIVWNDEAFENLVLPDDRKVLLQSLVEAHDPDSGFDDFIHGKGHGLVINLFGPPGVGKTLSAEATSEHVRAPLYIVGGGDLGASAFDLDAALNRVFDIATSWKAIVLIDEADVFLEQRSMRDMERNAMVAVFLRHIEYYRGILFLTTNRVKAFDEAFLSRIHVALHFRQLTPEARKQVWTAFLKKVGVQPEDFGPGSIDQLATREVNGRQIKNAVRTASSLAARRGVPLSYQHLTNALDTMEEFTTEVTFVGRRYRSLTGGSEQTEEVK